MQITEPLDFEMDGGVRRKAPNVVGSKEWIFGKNKG